MEPPNSRQFTGYKLPQFREFVLASAAGSKVLLTFCIQSFRETVHGNAIGGPLQFNTRPEKEIEMKARYLKAFPAIRVALVAVLLASLSAPSVAAEGRWSLRLEPIYMQVSGHDRPVVDIRQAGSGSGVGDKVTLTTDSGMAYRTQIQYRRTKWGFGVDFLWFKTTQSADEPRLSATGPPGAAPAISLAVPDRVFTSTGPDEVLFYNVLEDTALATWSWDTYAIRTLSAREDRTIDLQFGLRICDFDNDYRAAVGVEDVRGSRLDSSSNYPALPGPIVALAVEFRRGSHTFEGYLGQAVVFGDVELDARTRDYLGSFSENPDPPFIDDDRLQTTESETVPITDLRLKWRYRLTRRLSLGAGINSSTWWGLSVPPGVEPGGPGASRQFHESDLTFWGVTALIQVDL